MSIGSSIRAELYKLNVYATGGHFKSHVDTPHSGEMFGSLVVSLPSQFAGGTLVTRHQGRQVMFDWSSSPSAQWAAFFGDVEHEVLPVTSGYRVTLTYRLYHTSPSGPASFDVSNDLLHGELVAALQTPDFMRRGGTLGCFCQHKYANTSTRLDEFSPHLKGEDAVIYEAAKSLGLSIALKPILSKKFWKADHNPELLKAIDHDEVIAGNYDEDRNYKEENYAVPRFEYQINSPSNEFTKGRKRNFWRRYAVPLRKLMTSPGVKVLRYLL